MKTKMLASGNLIAYTQQKVKQQMSWSTISPGSKNNKPLRHELSSHNKPTNAKNSRQTAEQMLEKFAALIQITLSVTSWNFYYYINCEFKIYFSKQIS